MKIKDSLFVGVMVLTSPVWFPAGLIYSFGVMGYLLINNERIRGESMKLNRELKCGK